MIQMMVKNTGRATMYSNLVAASYTEDTANAEFLADLCRPIPFVPRDNKWPVSGVLATIPALVKPAKPTAQAILADLLDALDS
jgi:hypothetical protein